MNKLLIIGFTWPEPNSTAAGTRMLQLINLFLKMNYEITFVSTAAKNSQSYNLSSLGIKTEVIKLNDSSFDDFLLNLNPTVVMFDRFLTEEQFGWRVSENCPLAIRILDTEDLHFLRNSRIKILKTKNKLKTEILENELTIREISSILRCDLTLIISTYEIQLLKKLFKISKSLLHYIPFLTEKINLSAFENYPPFEDRNHFMTIGNFKHEPNWKSVLYLKNEIWPLIRKQLPKTELHIYGSYATEKVLQLNNKKEGFIIKGWTDSIENAYTTSKICLAPLQVGAGLKGKLLDAMTFGTPSVTTTIGAEGMQKNNEWNGYIENDPIAFSNKAIKLYSNVELWKSAQKKGIEIMNRLFLKTKHETKFTTHLEKIKRNLAKHRRENFYGNLLQQNHMKSTKFMAKWIEEKNR